MYPDLIFPHDLKDSYKFTGALKYKVNVMVHNEEKIMKIS